MQVLLLWQAYKMTKSAAVNTIFWTPLLIQKSCLDSSLYIACPSVWANDGQGMLAGKLLDIKIRRIAFYLPRYICSEIVI